MSTSEHSPGSDRTGCVLVVDDNDDLRHMWCLALESAGFDVIAAGTQVELQRRLVEAQPHALLINLQRSEADGLAMLSSVRARQALRDVPILFLSGSDDHEFHLRAISAGADWVGVRPLGMLQLQKQVSHLVSQGRPVAQQVRPKRGPGVIQLKRTG
jgi:two-component system KDP operon response regulator KdpE